MQSLDDLYTPPGSYAPPPSSPVSAQPSMSTANTTTAGTDYTKAVTDYGLDNLNAQLGPRMTNGEYKAYTQYIPGLGNVAVDAMGNKTLIDPTSQAAYDKDGTSPVYTVGWNDTTAPTTGQVSHGGLSPSTLAMIAAAVVTAGASTGWGAAAGIGSGAATGGLEAAAGYAIPTAEELAAGGFGTGGMGLTGSGGIGAASSLVDAGIGGSAGYGAAPGLAALDYSNEGLNYPNPESTANSPINATTGPTPTLPPYSNEGNNYLNPGSTSTSPINATTGPGAAPTVPLTGTPTLPGTTPTIPKIPGTTPGTGTGTGTGTGSGLDTGGLLQMLYGLYSKNNMANQLKGSLDSLTNMYKPGSPEALLMQHQMEAKDAAAGRRSQYGPREVELAGKLADSRMRTLSSPGYLNMQAAYLANAPGSGGLNDLFAAFGSGGNTPTGNAATSLTNYLKGLYNTSGGNVPSTTTPDYSNSDGSGNGPDDRTNGYDL